MPAAQLIQTLWDENRAKVLLLILLLGLIAGIQLWQGLRLAPQNEAARLQLRDLQAELGQERSKINAGGGEQVTSLSKDVERFYQLIPANSELGDFIGKLYSYAGKAGIDIDQINYSTEKVDDSVLLAYQLSFNVGGSYAQTKKFIQILENSPGILILQKISLVGARQEKEKIVRLQLQLQTFFKEDES